MGRVWRDSFYDSVYRCSKKIVISVYMKHFCTLEHPICKIKDKYQNEKEIHITITWIKVLKNQERKSKKKKTPIVERVKNFYPPRTLLEQDD